MLTYRAYEFYSYPVMLELLAVLNSNIHLEE